MFARYTFEHPERAAAELRAVLPQEIVAQVDWATLHRESGSVVDTELQELQSDLLFSAHLHGGQPLLFYFLLEHQSSVDHWMAFRMLRYVMRILERWLVQNPGSKSLPVVLPLVLYHGPEGRWTAPRRMEELFQLPAEALALWQMLVPRFEYRLDDLTAEREEALRTRPGPPMVPLALLLLRSGRSEELTVLMEGWRPLFAQVMASREGSEDLRAIVHYLFKVGVDAAYEALGRVLNSVAHEQGPEALMRTMEEMLIERGHERGWREGLDKGRAEGRAEGRTEGQARGRAEDVLRILEARDLAVDEQTRTRILSCTDLGTLDRWFFQALRATRLADLT